MSLVASQSMSSIASRNSASSSWTSLTGVTWQQSRFLFDTTWGIHIEWVSFAIPCLRLQGVIDFIADIVGRLRDGIGLSVLYHEIPTWVEPALLPPPSPDNETKESSDSSSKIEETAKIILYIGAESLTLTNLLMMHSSSLVSLVGRSL